MAQRREYQGGAVVARLAGGINDSDLTFDLDSTSGWPTGLIGPFLIVVDPGLSGEEKMIVTSRSGISLTVATRGADGTAASAHAANAIVKHVIGALDLDEVNKHAADTTQDDHSQYVHVGIDRTITADDTFSGTTTFSGDAAFTGTTHFTNPPTFDNVSTDAEITKVDATVNSTAGVLPEFANADHKHGLDRVQILRLMWRAGDFKIDPIGDAVDAWELAEWLDPAVVTTFNRTTYPELFARYGTRFGTGDGTTTAGLPNPKDLILSAAGGTRTIGTAGGTDQLTLTTTNLPAHNHTATSTVTDTGHTHNGSNAGGAYQFLYMSPNAEQNWLPALADQAPTAHAMQVIHGQPTATATTGISVSTTTTNTGSGTAITVPVPKYFGIRVLIKAH